MYLFKLLFYPDIHLGVGFLDHMVTVFSFSKNLNTVLYGGYTDLHPQQQCRRGPLFSIPAPAFIVCRLFDDGHSDWCDVILRCSFDLHFSNN